MQKCGNLQKKVGGTQQDFQSFKRKEKILII